MTASLETMTVISTPDWLKLHDGEARPSKDGQSLSVYFAGSCNMSFSRCLPGGKHACRISETINGRRIEGPAVYDSTQAALAGGLEDLRARLGW